MTAPAISVASAATTPDQVVWYRGPQGDHAFGTTSGYLRSRCGDVRWNVWMAFVEGTVHACPRCLAAIAPRAVAPESEGEKREAWGR